MYLEIAMSPLPATNKQTKKKEGTINQEKNIYKKKIKF